MSSLTSNEYGALLDELKEIRKECGDGHADTATALAVFNAQIKAVNGQLTDIQSKVDPLMSQVAVNSSNIGKLEKDKDTLFVHITSVKDALRRGSPLPSTPDQQTQTQNGRSFTPSFWDGENAKYAFYLAIAVLVVVGLATGAMTSQDIKDIAP